MNGDAQAALAAMVAEGDALQANLGGHLTDRLTGWLLPHYAQAAQARLAEVADPAERWALLRGIAGDLTALRRGDLLARRLTVEQERLEVTRKLTEEAKAVEFEEWLKRPEVQKRINPRVRRDTVMRRVHQVMDHFILGRPLEEFEFMDDPPAAEPGPAAATGQAAP